MFSFSENIVLKKFNLNNKTMPQYKLLHELFSKIKLKINQLESINLRNKNQIIYEIVDIWN